MLVSGKITKKSVKSGEYGDKVSFLVGGNWLSAFAADKKLDQDTKDMLRSLTEGDEAEFNIVEAENKVNPSKPYLNIKGVIKVTRLDVPDVAPPVQPSGHAGDTPKQYHQDAPDSMILSYAKDGAIRLSKDGDSPDEFARKVFVIYRYLKAILAGTYNPEENIPF